MNNQIVNVDVLPDCWIQKQSKRRPDQIYYFNTATGKSQWISPSISPAGDKQRKQLTQKEPSEPPKENGKGEGNSFKISSHSKQSNYLWKLFPVVSV